MQKLSGFMLLIIPPASRAIAVACTSSGVLYAWHHRPNPLIGSLIGGVSSSQRQMRRPVRLPADWEPVRAGRSSAFLFHGHAAAEASPSFPCPFGSDVVFLVACPHCTMSAMCRWARAGRSSASRASWAWTCRRRPGRCGSWATCSWAPTTPCLTPRAALSAWALPLLHERAVVW